MQKSGCTSLWDDAFGAGAVVLPEGCGAEGVLGTWGRVAGDPQGDARQNYDSAQSFQQVCAAQQSQRLP